MSPTQKTLLGILSFLPLALLIGFMISLMGPLQALMTAAAQHPNDPSAALPYLPDMFSSGFALMILMVIATVTLLIIFIIHVSKNKTISDGERIMWIILFFVAGTLAFPVYFFVRIAGSQPAPPALT